MRVRAPRLQRSREFLVHRSDDIVAGERKHDDVALCRDVHDGLRDSDLAIAELVQKLLALLFGSVPDQQRRLLLLLIEVGPAMVGEVAGHEITHRAQPDPPDLDRGVLIWRLRTRVWQILSQFMTQ